MAPSGTSVHPLVLLRQASYTSVTSVALLLYDYSLTVDAEPTLIWSAPWSLGKALFLLTRYLPFLDSSLSLYRDFGPKTQRCSLHDSIIGWSLILGTTIAELIMVLRVWALWTRSRWVGVGLALLSAATLVGAGIAYIKFSQQRTCEHEPTSIPAIDTFNQFGCRPLDGSNTERVIFIIVTVFEILMLILTVTRVLLDDQTLRASSVIRGVMYYALLAISSTVNAVMISKTQSPIATMLVLPQRILHSILSARIILRVRGDALNRKAMFVESMPISDSVFAGSCVIIQASQDRTAEWFGDPYSRFDEL
ncbi:hypothetical protein PLEOSDRAFT_156616 [Pleurotus ostreatus PC15]|uniref:DUF6533 domain-containing protein n=1 Tax=Pleurotus ostreatus (strain PC15) TaxID=1137138 RepID=A0A067NLU7_PLEO1|nr:hypothetical protein PLEOSDRAFT_156616 [Pleurotus ostreatus PC15]